MSSSTAFNVSRDIGNNFSKSFRRVDDENAIESILSQASQSDDPGVLRNSISKILSQVSPERRGDAIKHLEKSYDNVQKKQVSNNIYQTLLDAEYSPETARLWADQYNAAPVGGKTEIIKHVSELVSRSKKGRGRGGVESEEFIETDIEIPGVETNRFKMNFPEIKQPEGRTPSDMVAFETANTKINTPLYSETINKLNSLDDEFNDLSILQEYNETPGALPEGTERWNVDWETGDLRVKALATPEAQAYIKTIARMARKAQDFFPGRVTNFDLQQFKEGFPTLANSKAGRDLIAKQLMLANRIAYLQEETLKSAMEYYGANSDPMQIRKYAQENYRVHKKELEKQLVDTNNEAKNYVRDAKKKVKEAKAVSKEDKELQNIFGF